MPISRKAFYVMNKPYTQEELIGGLSKSLNDQYQQDRNNVFNPKYDVQHIKDHFQEILNAYTHNKREAQNYYIPALKEDMVFGDDKWSARDRFLNQKKQLYSALCAYRAKEIHDEAIDQLEGAINEVNTPYKVDEEGLKQAYAQYEQDKINEIVNKQVGINQRKADRYKKKRARLVGLFVPGIILLVLSIIGAVWFWRLAILNIRAYDSLGYPFPESLRISTELKMQFAYAIMFTVYLLVGVGMILPNRIYAGKRRKYMKTLKVLTPMIKEDLNTSSKELIQKYNNKYTALFDESAAYRKAANDTLVGCLGVFKKYDESYEALAVNYKFCANMSYDQIECLYSYMEKGIVDSYTNALQHFENEVQKEMERHATEEYRKQMVDMNKEHFSKMESAAQDQALAAAQQAEAARRQAQAASDAAYYTKVQAEEAKKQTREAKKQTNIIKKW